MTPADFQLWIKANPQVWFLFCKFTREVQLAGHLHYSADAILHRIRWETDINPTSSGQAAGRALKLNNSWTPFLARMYHDLYPEHEGFFRTRKSKQDIDEAVIT